MTRVGGSVGPGSRDSVAGSRWSWSAMVAVGATIAVLAGISAGVVAQLRHEVVSEGNTLTSGVVEVGPGLSVALAVGESCADADWTTDPIPAVLVAAVDLADGAWQHLGPVVCLRNETDVALALTATGRDVSDQEDGDCEEAEQEAGDATCADGDAGELGQVTTLAWDLVKRGSGRTDCAASPEAAFTTSTAGVSLGVIDGGEVCRFRPAARLADGAEVQVAQTDRLGWDAVLTGDAVGEAAGVTSSEVSVAVRSTRAAGGAT